MYLLFPGRHHLLTQFQFDYLQDLLSKPIGDAVDIDGKAFGTNEKITAIIFAVI